MSISYENDGYGWAMEQAALIRAGRLSELDLENVAEEIESVGKTERKELVNRLVVLLCHLLKWQYQPDRQSNSWRVTIKGQRRDIVRHIAKNPSMKSEIDDAIFHAYEEGRDQASVETGLAEKVFPDLCPWPWSQIIDSGFWPDMT